MKSLNNMLAKFNLEPKSGICEIHGDYEGLSFPNKNPMCPKCLLIESRQGRDMGQELKERLLGEANIPQKFRCATIRNFEPSSERIAAARKKIVRYVEQLDLRQWQTAFLWGNPGTGKTHVLCGMVRAAIVHKSGNAKYMTERDVVDFVRDSYGSHGMSERSQLDRLINIDFLALDELGAHSPTPNFSSIISDVICYRYDNEKPTAFASNHSFKALEIFFGPRAADRLRSGMLEINFDWQSRR